MKWQPDGDQVDFAIMKTAEIKTSTNPQWRDTRRRLEQLGIEPDDAVQAEGQHFMFGLIASRDGRLFIFDATFDAQVGSRDTWCEEQPQTAASVWDSYSALEDTSR